VTKVTNVDFSLIEFCRDVVKDVLFMNFIWKNKITLIGIIVGSIAGYFYYRFYGCTGTCTITSSPTNSSLYGALMGGLLFSIFKKEKSNSENDKPRENE
jgi:hypothetical protein